MATTMADSGASGMAGAVVTASVVMNPSTETSCNAGPASSNCCQRCDARQDHQTPGRPQSTTSSGGASSRRARSEDRTSTSYSSRQQRRQRSGGGGSSGGNRRNNRRNRYYTIISYSITYISILNTYYYVSTHPPNMGLARQSSSSS